MTDRATVFLRGARDCFGVPALAISAALTGYGVMARDNGLDLSVTVVSVLSLWGLPAMMTYAELVGPLNSGRIELLDVPMLHS